MATTKGSLSRRTLAVDENRLNAFMGGFVRDVGAVMHAATIVVGDKLGLYKALADGPPSAQALAQRTATDPRYLREWLSAQAASGYVDYDAGSDRFSLNDEQAFALTVEGGPAFILTAHCGASKASVSAALLIGAKVHAESTWR